MPSATNDPNIFLDIESIEEMASDGMGSPPAFAAASSSPMPMYNLSSASLIHGSLLQTLVEAEKKPKKIDKTKPSIFHDSRNAGVITKTGPAFGIEYELEFHNPCNILYGVLNDQKPNQEWRAIKDGSLRGHSVELVSRPMSANAVKKSTAKIMDFMNDMGLQINSKSRRVSSHAHMNVQDLTPTQIFNAATIWWLLEDMLVETCGESRVGNNFCLRARDATRTVTAATQVYQNLASDMPSTKLFNNYFQDKWHKYSALNLCPLNKFGTLEFRTFPGLHKGNMDEFFNWIDQLLLIRKRAVEFSSPYAVCEAINEMGDDEFLKYMLTPYYYDRCVAGTIKDLTIKKFQKTMPIVFSLGYAIDPSKLPEFKKGTSSEASSSPVSDSF